MAELIRKNTQNLRVIREDFIGVKDIVKIYIETNQLKLIIEINTPAGNNKINVFYEVQILL
jgi:hypothetical protein